MQDLLNNGRGTVISKQFRQTAASLKKKFNKKNCFEGFSPATGHLSEISSQLGTWGIRHFYGI
jgi:hypothetical protein